MYTTDEFIKTYGEVELKRVHMSKTKKGDVGKFYTGYYRIRIHDDVDHLIIYALRKDAFPETSTIKDLCNDELCTNAFASIFPVRPTDSGFGDGKFHMILKQTNENI
jgi:hypothetical protein